MTSDTSVRAASNSLFQVYLRLRPPPSPLVQLTQQSLYPLLAPPERYLTVEPPSPSDGPTSPTHITVHPPADSRKRAIEKFAFTKVFEEEAGQLEIFKGTGVVPLIEGVLGEGRDGLLATLGVTGSGKSHTILGSKSQRGLTQLSLDLLYRSLGKNLLHPLNHLSLLSSLNAADTSESQIFSAQAFLDAVYGDTIGANSRATTPMTVGRNFISPNIKPQGVGPRNQWSILGLTLDLSLSGSTCRTQFPAGHDVSVPSPAHESVNDGPRRTRTQAKLRFANTLQDPNFVPNVPKRQMLQRHSALPQFPDISDFSVPIDEHNEYAIVVSMYEVYNDRIFDLLSHPRNPKDTRRRALLFKPTEASPDRKVVAGLRKIVCGSYEEALMVLETGLMERRVAGTGSNSVSSRSHGFFCLDVKRRPKGGMASSWKGTSLTIVDLAGSERARNAKTAGATLAEAGKINESLMYLGQCLQMQSDCHDGSKTIVPFRQCKLTELLFSNSFPSPNHSNYQTHNNHHHHRNPQKAVMIVTADPLGDFNATSQILRYSALAREITVPRIPSVTSTILGGTTAGSSRPPSREHHAGSCNHSVDEAALEMAYSEIARLGEESEILSVKLAEQEGRRQEAEENWQRAEERAEQIELRVREECWAETEQRLNEERRRWMIAREEEADRVDEHMDRKLDILSKGIEVYEDPEAPSEHIQNLENENAALRRQIDMLWRELQSRSPTKPSKFATAQQQTPPQQQQQSTIPLPPGYHLLSPQREDSPRISSRQPLYSTRLSERLQELTLQDDNELGNRVRNTPVAKTPGGTGRKVRKFTARKWDLGDENELDGF